MKGPRIVAAPSSFKGSLPARAACVAITEGLHRVWEDAEVSVCPMADGGEGTLDAILPGPHARRRRAVEGAAGQTRVAEYGVVDAADERIAVIEVATVVGLTHPDNLRADVTERSTRGVGELLRACLDEGIRRFEIGIGGTSTNDGGAGMLAALGARLLDADEREVAPTPAGLSNLARIDASGLDPRLFTAELTVLSDVDNPLAGDRGATATFGPQKGVRPQDVAELDAVLARYAERLEEALDDLRVAHLAGAGAAGGLGFALLALGGRLRSGANVVAERIGLPEALHRADWVITGEGRTDVGTLAGKAPFVVAERARAAGVATTLISGALHRPSLTRLNAIFSGCFALPDGPMSDGDSIANAGVLLADRCEQVARLWQAARVPSTARPRS